LVECHAPAGRTDRNTAVTAESVGRRLAGTVKEVAVDRRIVACKADVRDLAALSAVAAEG
jgi:NAD(P)-dependent dehydrogenase (short-subunit alcohol dehydrogenase family)